MHRRHARARPSRPPRLGPPRVELFCDAARERAIAEGAVARCLGVAADAVPRLAGAVAAAVREATRPLAPPAPTRTAGKAKTGFWPNLPGLGLIT